MDIRTIVHHTYEATVHASHRAHTVVHTVYFGLVGVEAHGKYRYAAAILFVAALVEAGHSYVIKVREAKLDRALPHPQIDMRNVVSLDQWKETHHDLS